MLKAWVAKFLWSLIESDVKGRIHDIVVVEMRKNAADISSDFGKAYEVIDRLNRRLKAAEEKIRNHEAAWKQIMIAGDGSALPQDRNWAVVAYKRGRQDIVQIFDFGTGNMGALVDWLQRFHRAGACVKVDLPYGGRGIDA